MSIVSSDPFNRNPGSIKIPSLSETYYIFIKLENQIVICLNYHTIDNSDYVAQKLAKEILASSAYFIRRANLFINTQTIAQLQLDIITNSSAIDYIHNFTHSAI